MQLLDTEGAVLSELTDSNFIYKDDSTSVAVYFNLKLTINHEFILNTCELIIIIIILFSILFLAFHHAVI